LLPVVLITGLGVADGSTVTAFVVPFTVKALEGVIVPMPMLPLICFVSSSI
tara:strand:- start:3216 stop:3368 length:153 start_codon:yes stop_codon:yes gene_type:complete